MSAMFTTAAPGPRRIPHARMRELDYFIGTWTATGTVREAPFERDRPIRATISTSLAEGGFCHQVRIQGQPSPEDPDPHSALQLWGYDLPSDHYLSYCIDNRGRHAQLSSAASDSRILVFEGWVTDAGARLPLRRTLTRHGPDQYRRVDQIKLDASWETVAEADVFRHKPTGLPRVYTGQLPEAMRRSR